MKIKSPIDNSHYVFFEDSGRNTNKFLQQENNGNRDRNSLTVNEIKNVIRESLRKEKKYSISWKILILVGFFAGLLFFPIYDRHKINVQKVQQMIIINEKLENGLIDEDDLDNIKEQLDANIQLINDFQRQIDTINETISNIEKANTTYETESEKRPE